jgi:hypothetical protein
MLALIRRFPIQKLKCMLGFHEAVHPFVREEPGVRWWRCGHCSAIFDLPAEH